MAAPEDSAKATIWLATWGSRGDHEPIAALALGLRAAGHSVKVFGWACMAKLFAAFDLDFQDLCGNPALNKDNKELRADLHRRALAAGFEGANAAEDYLLDVHILECEYTCKDTLRLAREEGLEAVAKRFLSGEPNNEKAREGRLDRWKERKEACLKWHAEDSNLSVEECTVRREEFRAHWQKLADDRGISAVTAFRAWDMKTFVPASSLEMLEEWMGDRFAWQQPGADVSEWFAKFQRKEPQWLEVASFNLGSDKWKAENLLHTYDSAHHKPDVCICHSFAQLAARVLKHLRGVSMLPFSTTPTFPAPIPLRIIGFGAGVLAEDKLGYGHSIAEAGPWDYLSSGEGPCNLVGFSVLRLDENDYSNRFCDSESWLSTVRSCFTGTWCLDEVMPTDQQRLSDLYSSTSDQQRLSDFLAAEADPPVYFGWGSMQHPDGPGALASLLVQTLRLTGCRAVFVSSWSSVTQEVLKEAFREEYSDEPSLAQEAEAKLLVLRAAHLSRLLPSCVAAVHHGGCGTTHTVLRAGTPMVVTPVVLDQFDNAKWVQVALGCGLATCSLELLEAEELAEKLTKVIGDEAVKARAQEVAAQVRAEPGVAGAVQFTEKFLRERPDAAVAGSVEVPCADGVYSVSMRGRELARVKLQGGKAFTEGKPYPVAAMRLGKFWKRQKRQEGEEQGWDSFNVQVIWFELCSVDLGNTSSDGEAIFFASGSELRLQGSQPQG